MVFLNQWYRHHSKVLEVVAGGSCRTSGNLLPGSEIDEVTSVAGLVERAPKPSFHVH